MLGYKPDEYIGHHISEFHADTAVINDILACLTRGHRLHECEARLKCKDGSIKDVLIDSSVLRDGERFIHTQCFTRNITERKRAEAALAAAKEELEKHAQGLGKIVQERTAELHATIAELEAFCYSLSHDMRAPLRAIQSYSQMVLIDFGPNLGQVGADYLQKIISAAQRSDRLIQDVLVFTRLARQEITVGSINVDKLVQEIIQERPEFQPPKAEITIEGPLLSMLGHEALVTQCVTNLLDNAVKFVARGVKPRVRIYTESLAGQVRLFFHDNGIGVDTEGQRRLFHMFQRIDTGDPYDGTGIGLAIVRRAVERMSGRAGVESEPGKGSRFWVQLPKGEE